VTVAAPASGGLYRSPQRAWAELVICGRRAAPLEAWRPSSAREAASLRQCPAT